MSTHFSARILREKLGFQIGQACLVPDNLPNLIHTDSRSIQAGQWFWPIVGESFDGHSFIPEVMAKGAIGFAYQSSHKDSISAELRNRGIEVEDSTRDLQRLSSLWRTCAAKQNPGLRLVGITGSSGKTTAKELLSHVLASVGMTLATKGSLNNEIGVPLSLCQITGEHRYAVIEMGARHEGDIKFLCKLALPDVSLLLNVGVAHIGEFGGLEALRRTKLEIYTSTPRHSIAVCPSWAPELLRVACEHHDRVISFGPEPEADVRLVTSEANSQGQLVLEVEINSELIKIVLPFYHEALAINVCATLACALALNAPTSHLVTAFEGFRGVRRRFEIQHRSEMTVIDDSYNANPESMMVGLRSLQQGFSKFRKILLLGDMLELGEQSQKAHEQVGEFCAALQPELLITVGQESQAIASSAEQHGLVSQKIRHYPSIQELRPDLAQLLKSGNLLYAKASNSIKLYQVVDELT